jgi:hypothetical protein
MAEEILPGAAEQASTLFADLTEQRWDHVCAHFDQRVAGKLDASGSAANYTKPLPFSPQLQQALRSLAQQNL